MVYPHLINGIWSSQFFTETRIRMITCGRRIDLQRERKFMERLMIWTMLILFPQTWFLLVRKLCCISLKTTWQWSRWSSKDEVQQWDMCHQKLFHWPWGHGIHKNLWKNKKLGNRNDSSHVLQDLQEKQVWGNPWHNWWFQVQMCMYLGSQLIHKDAYGRNSTEISWGPYRRRRRQFIAALQYGGQEDGVPNALRSSLSSRSQIMSLTLSLRKSRHYRDHIFRDSNFHHHHELNHCFNWDNFLWSLKLTFSQSSLRTRLTMNFIFSLSLDIWSQLLDIVKMILTMTTAVRSTIIFLELTAISTVTKCTQFGLLQCLWLSSSLICWPPLSFCYHYDSRVASRSSLSSLQLWDIDHCNCWTRSSVLKNDLKKRMSSLLFIVALKT